MQKQEIMRMWAENPVVKEGKLKVKPISYKHEGSTFDHDSIRITGSKYFIWGIMSRLKDLLEYEGDDTRLQLALNDCKDKETGEIIDDSFNAYIQVHMRGDEARMTNGFVRAIKEKKHKAIRHESED